MPPRDTTLEPIEDITRRRLLTAIPGLVLVAGGVACGGDDDDSDPTAEATDAPGATATPSAYPRTISHELGEATLDARPVRVVAQSDGAPLDHVLAIGVQPVLYGQTAGYDGDSMLAPWAAEVADPDLESYATERGEPDIERIAAATPDVIFCAWTGSEVYDSLAGVAPTISIKESDAVAWTDMQRLVGQALGMEDEAEAALAETEAVIAAGAERLAPYADRTVMIGYKFFDTLFVHGDQTPIGRLIPLLGLSVVAPDQAILSELSLEQVEVLADADILLSPVFFPEDQEAFEANPLVQQLPAVQEGRYVPLDVDIAEAGYVESTLSVRWVIPLLVDAIIQAAEGNGRTLS